MARVIVALDGTKSSEQGLALATAMTAVSGDTIDLVHVLNLPETLNETFRVRQAGAEEYLGRCAATLEPDHVGECIVFTGDPATELRRYALQRPGSTVVLGSRTDSTLRRRVFGSVARSLLQFADVALAIATHDSPVVPTTLNTTLVPLDGSTTAEMGINAARTLAANSAALICLIRVIHPVRRPIPNLDDPTLQSSLEHDVVEMSHEARHYLHTLSQALRADGVRCLWEVRTGCPGEEILRAAETTGCDLIVLVNRPRNVASEPRVSDVMDYLTQLGGLPVLIVPASDPDTVQGGSAPTQRLIASPAANRTAS